MHNLNSVKIGRNTARMAMASHPYHHGDLRKALVDEAFDVLRAGGVEAVSLRAVATAIGVSPSAAYHHFPDKKALLVALGDKAGGLFDDRLLAAAKAVRGRSDSAAINRFMALGRAYIDFAQDEPNLFRHMFSELCVGSSPLSGGESVAFDTLLASLDALVQRGLLRSDIREGLELVAWSCVHGFAVLAADGQVPAAQRDDLLAALCRMTVAGSQPQAET
jgi:AcrR family transcriptional regulator